MFDTKKSRTALSIAIVVGISTSILALAAFVPVRDYSARAMVATADPTAQKAIWTEDDVRGLGGWFADICGRCCSHGHGNDAGSWQHVILMPDPRGGDGANSPAAHYLHTIYDFDLGPKPQA